MSNLSPTYLFYFFSGILVFSAATGCCCSHSVFSLIIFSFKFFMFHIFNFSFLECEFLALIFIIVYVGAIAVLIFVRCYDVRCKIAKFVTKFFKVFTSWIFFGLSFFHTSVLSNFKLQLKYKFCFFKILNYINWYDLVDSTVMESYGQVLYSYFILQFLSSWLILLVVLIGIVYLTKYL
jgi:NADH-quinone oxidoreductase subunit J